jgi:electron transfer flavoprotein beta subunit
LVIPEDRQLNIVVAVKLVPDTNADKRIDPQTRRLVRSAAETVLNPFDEYAIEAGLQLKEQLADGSSVTIVTMAPESGKEVVRKALAMGADRAVMLSDPAFAGSDVWATAYVLAAGIRRIGFDLVLTGTQSTDAITGELPGALAEYLGVPGLTYAREIHVAAGRVRVKRETDTGYQTLSAPLPALASITKSAAEPRFASLKGIMAAKKKEIAVLRLADLEIAQAVGGDGAKLEVTELTASPARAAGKTVTAADGNAGARTIVAFLKERNLL